MSSGNSSDSVNLEGPSSVAPLRAVEPVDDTSSSPPSYDDGLVTGRSMRRKNRKLKKKVASLQRELAAKNALITSLRHDLDEANLVLEGNSERDRELGNAHFRRGFETCKQRVKDHFGDEMDLSFLFL